MFFLCRITDIESGGVSQPLIQNLKHLLKPYYLNTVSSLKEDKEGFNWLIILKNIITRCGLRIKLQ